MLPAHSRRGVSASSTGPPQPTDEARPSVIALEHSDAGGASDENAHARGHFTASSPREYPNRLRGHRCIGVSPASVRRSYRTVCEHCGRSRVLEVVDEECMLILERSHLRTQSLQETILDLQVEIERLKWRLNRAGL